MPSYESDSVTSPDGITHLTQMNPTLREHHTCYEVNANTDSSQKHSTSSGNITLVTKSTPTLINPISLSNTHGTQVALQVVLASHIPGRRRYPDNVSSAAGTR